MKDRIIMAAYEEINRRGLKFTIDDVAARVGISKKTLYQYYASKDNLISAIVEWYLAEITKQYEEVIKDDSKSYLDKLWGILAEPHSIGRPSNSVMADVKKYRPEDWEKIQQFRYGCCRQLAGLLEEGINLGFIKPLQTELTATMLLGAAEHFLQEEFLRQNNLSFYDVFQSIADVFLFGVLSEEGKKAAKGEQHA